MTSEERVCAAIRLEKPDRVPVVPTLLPEPAARLAGLSQAQVAANSQLAVEAIFKVFDEYGAWDNPYLGAYAPIELQAIRQYPMKMRIPGKDLADDSTFQLDEQEILKPEDYDTIAEIGIDKFYYEDYLWRITDLRRDELPGTFERVVGAVMSFANECALRGTRMFFGADSLHPFFALSLMRSMVPFTQDLYYNPAPVERALKRMTADLISSQIRTVKQTGVKRLLLVEERASGFFYPPAVFERFWLPYTRQIVEALWSEGIVTIFHLDQCWDKNIPYFTQLPRGSAVVELDSTTNIFAAKDALRGHLCLHGDVPAALLSIGTPEDVASYCKRLIDKVGRDGGFILGSGCSVPADVKRENFRSMIETGKGYELSRK